VTALVATCGTTTPIAVSGGCKVNASNGDFIGGSYLNSSNSWRCDARVTATATITVYVYCM
jgi:hypothetical protein